MIYQVGFGIWGCRIIHKNIHLTENNLLLEVQRKWERIIKMKCSLNWVGYVFENKKDFFRMILTFGSYSSKYSTHDLLLKINISPKWV